MVWRNDASWIQVPNTIFGLHPSGLRTFWSTSPKYVFFLVVRDVEGYIGERKANVPGVVASNIFRFMTDNDKTLDKQKQVTQILAMHEETRCRDLSFGIKDSCHLRIAGHKPVLLPARSIRLLECSVTPSSNCVCGVVEHWKASPTLTEGVRLGPSLGTVDVTGRVPVQFANFSEQDVYLRAKTPFGIARLAQRESQMDLVSVSVNKIEVRDRCYSEWKDQLTEQLISRMDIGENMCPGQELKLQDIIHHHVSAFSKSDDDLGFCGEIEHRIRTTVDNPLKIAHSRMPPHLWTEVRDYLQTALDNKIIRWSSSPCASPVVLAREIDGELRLCCDYRALKGKTVKDAYPLPRIEEALGALKGAKYFCSLDLAHGFHQIPMADSNIEKTAFRVGTKGLFGYSRMPFALSSCNIHATKTSRLC